ncbi:MAG TPA: tetratricopeptide repeat protein [Thermoanaerobaculia bacterium]|nr:tetratricopeptide repeat protein [Thermoanaerobaculia bacterium]
MRRSFVLAALALAALPALGCQRLQARVELKKGNSLYQQEQYSAALTQFKKGLELDPSDTFAWRSVGLTALALYRPGDDSPKNISYGKTAIDAFENYLADNPDDTKIQDYLMSTYVNAKQDDKALAFVDKLESQHPEEKSRFDKYRVNVLIQAGRLEDAADLAMKTPGPEQPVSLYTIGVAAWAKVYNNATIDAETKSKKIEMGLKTLDQALKLKPDYYDAMFYYGLLLRQKANLEIDGQKRLDLQNLAQDYLKKGLEMRKKAQAAPAIAPGK